MIQSGTVLFCIILGFGGWWLVRLEHGVAGGEAGAVALRQKNFFVAMQYFTIPELTRSATARRMGIDNTPPASAIAALSRLVDAVLDPLREAWGAPLTVNSGYRCPALNRAVGGVPHSQHLLGEAADITTGSRHGNRRLWQLLRRLNLPVDQAINEHGYQWLHISYGPRHRRQYLTVG